MYNIKAEELDALTNKVNHLNGRIAELERALPPADKLRYLSEWFELRFPEDDQPEVQTSLRRWADQIDAARKEIEK